MFNLLNKNFAVYNFKGIEIEARYWMAIVIVILIFLLVFTLARLRYLYVHWNISGTSISFLFYGFLLALILEGFLLVSGRTVITEFLGWENAPKPISTVLDMGKDRLVDVLGVENQNMSVMTEKSNSYQKVITDYESLDEDDKDLVKNYLCTP